MPQRKPRKGATEFSVDDRWTPEIASGGFTPVANGFLDHYGSLHVRPAEALLLIHLMSYKWDKRNPWPSVPTLAERMGRSQRYIRKLCADLETKGLLKRLERNGRSNSFDLTGLFTCIKKRMEEHAASKFGPVLRQVQGGA